MVRSVHDLEGAADWHSHGVESVQVLDRESLSRLASGELGAVRVPKFFSLSECAEAFNAISMHGLTQYTTPSSTILKIGPAFIEYQENPEGYFALAKAANDVRRQMFQDPLPDPVDRVMSQLSRAGFKEVTTATEPDHGGYFIGIVREINKAALPHIDWAPFQSPGSTVSKILREWSWNIYLTVPPCGGELTIYRRPWEPELEAFKLPDSYGYSLEAVSGVDKVTLQPTVGELILFNSRNLHAVLEVEKPGRRVTVSSFIGETPNGELLLWS